MLMEWLAVFFSIVKSITIRVNGIQVYDNTEANQTVDIKNFLEFDRSYMNTASNYFYYLDSRRTANVGTNTGFLARKTILGASVNVNSEIPLTRYSFFEVLEDQILPNTKVEIQVEIESDANLVWENDADCRVIITKFQLWVPRLQFNSKGQSMYMSQYLTTHKWTYLREMFESVTSLRQQTGSFRITAGISKPRHVFVWMLNDARVNSSKQNPFIFDTINVANQTLDSCHLEVGNGHQYPAVECMPSTNISRVFRDVLGYTHSNNDYKGSTLLTQTTFKELYKVIYFDITKQKEAIKDGTTKLTFKYKLSGRTNANYSVFSLVLYEQDVELVQSSGKLLLRS